MRHAQTIAMARGLLAEGRAADVARMLEPLVEPVPRHVPGALDADQLALRCLLARVRLLRYGDPVQALALLKPFEAAAAREQVAPAIRAEVALWLGWTHTWQHTPTYDDARALHLLDEAERLFRDEMNTAGRCWALLGQARAYFFIDEHSLMLRALHEAAALQENVGDVQAALWAIDLHTLGARFQGRYALALTYAEALGEQARQHDDGFAAGRAHAYRAMVYEDLGRAPEAVTEAAAEAETLLPRAAVKPGYALRAAFQAHVRAQVRRGAWAAADRLIDTALGATSNQPSAASHLLLERARLALRRGRFEQAEATLQEVDAHADRQPRRLPAAGVALAWSALWERQGLPEAAAAWAERAYRIARETGHRGLQLRALLGLARISLAQGHEEAARRFLGETQPFSDAFSVLPVGALRYAVLGELALVEDAPDEACAYFDQARAAYALTGDVYRAAQMQVKLARVAGARRPAQARATLETARHTFARLGAPLDGEEARVLLAACPEDPGQAVEAGEPDIGVTLARASLSVDLVAEAWLKATERLLPDRWMGIYRCDEGRPWTCVRERRAAPAAPPRTTEPCSTRLFSDGVLWLRLRSHPGPAFFFGVALSDADDPAWAAAHARMKPWMPVASLALDHALLRAERPGTAGGDGAGGSDAAAPLKAFVYASPALRALVQQIHRMRASHSPVLITGEPGTGKALVARAIHAVSERKEAPFVTFPCAGVAEAVTEGHLFGQQGSGEGALHAAEGGTLFLDDVGALPLAMQHKLLRFLRHGEILPAGSRAPLPLNVRIVAATHRDLKALIRAGHFVEELYYQLHVISLHVPPLRERREDIPLLARHFVDVLRPPGTPPPSLTQRALEALLRYDWPGNVRQLRNEVERALVFTRSEPAPLIDVKDLSAAVAEGQEEAPQPDLLASAQEAILHPGQDLDQVMAGTEKVLIERVLAEHEGQVTASANALGLSRQGLYKKMKRLGIDASSFHPE